MDKQQPSPDQNTSVCTQKNFDPAVSSRSQSLGRLRRSQSGSSFFDIYRKAMPGTQEADVQVHSASNFTRTLHDEGDGNPAITLTTYTVELSGRPATNFLSTSRKLSSPGRAEEALVNRSNPRYETLHEAEHVTNNIELVLDRTESQKTPFALEKLKIEVDEHFERLKSKYEQKRGTKWAPLLPHDQESYIWECESNEGHYYEN